MPSIRIQPDVEITDELADRFAACFPPGVVEVKTDSHGAASAAGTCVVASAADTRLTRPAWRATVSHVRAWGASTGRKRAVVTNPRNDTVSREVLRHPDLAPLVSLGRVPDHFICM